MNSVKNVAFYGYPVFDIDHWRGWRTPLDEHPGYSTSGRALPVEWNSKPATVRALPYFKYPCKGVFWTLTRQVFIGA